MHFERSFGAARLLAGLSFSLGLILVVVGGAELFTGNSLLVMAWCARKVSTRALLRNWGIVYAGYFVGALRSRWLSAVLHRRPMRQCQYFFVRRSADCAAATRAIGTRKGEQET